MALDYSQKRLIGKALHAHGNSRHAKRLRMYAFLTGILSLLISLVNLYIHIIKPI